MSAEQKASVSMRWRFDEILEWISEMGAWILMLKGRDVDAGQESDAKINLFSWEMLSEDLIGTKNFSLTIQNIWN